MSEFSFRYLWYCVTTAFVSFSVASRHLNLQIFIAGDAFDDPAFFDEQLEFAGLIGIAIQIGGEIDAPSWYPIPFYDTLASWLLPPAKPVITVSGLAISVSFSIREAERRHLDRAPG
jgi:hypothetical protein